MSHLAAKFLLVLFPLVLLAACEQKNETSAANATPDGHPQAQRDRFGPNGHRL